VRVRTTIPGVNQDRARHAAALMAIASLVAGCLNPGPTPSPTQAAVAPTAAPTATPGANPRETITPNPLPSSFPLAVVTGMTNLKAATTVVELTSLAAKGQLVMPCGIEVTAPVLAAAISCMNGIDIAATIEADQSVVALLPPGLVEPATKILPIDGTGPFGLFGADIFGDPAARALPYPITARATDQSLPVEWLTYDPGPVWTIASVGGSCPDRGAPYQALTLHKGWDWVFNGGTAKYKGPPFLNPSPPTGIIQHLIVRAVDTGHAGTVARLIAGADLTIADVECPIVDAADFVPNFGRALTFSIRSDVLPLWRDKLGFDVLYMAANHNTDKGVPGVRSSIRLLDQYGIEHTGVGMNLDQALEPAYVTRAGVKIAFVAWNIVPGVTRATATTPGVPWLTRALVIQGVQRARAGGAQVVICDPQWWGGAEYHSDFKPGQLAELAWFDEAGCDHVIGAGTHLAGPMMLRRDPTGSGNGQVGVVMASEGNLMFGQDFWQLTQEGVIMRLAFRGTELVNVHLDPYVMLFNSRAALIDPETDGHYVLERVWANSDVNY